MKMFLSGPNILMHQCIYINTCLPILNGTNKKLFEQLIETPRDKISNSRTLAKNNGQSFQIGCDSVFSL